MVKTRTSRLAELTEYVKYKTVFYLSFRLTNMILFNPGRTIHIKFVKSYLQRYTNIKAPIKLAGISNFKTLQILQGNQPYLDWISECVPDKSQ